MNKKKLNLPALKLSDEVLNTHSQLEIVRRIIDQKKYVLNSDFMIQLSDQMFDTLDCETETDFLNKYQSQLDAIGIKPYSIKRVTDDDNISYRINVDLTDSTRYVNSEDNNLPQNEVTQISLSTFNCDNISDFQIKNKENLDKLSPQVVNQILDQITPFFEKENIVSDSNIAESNTLEDIITILKQMIEEKNKTGEEVFYKYNGIDLSTENCNDLINLYLKYNNEIFTQYEQKRNSLLQQPSIQQSINDFQKTEKKDDSLFNEYIQVLSQANSLDFSNSNAVNNWLEKLKKYINNPNLKLSNSQISASENIVSILNRHGYTSEMHEVNTVDDFYKRFISYAIKDLEEYHFFATDYAEELDRNLRINKESALIELIEKQKILQVRLSLIEQYENGILNNYVTRIDDSKNMNSFDDRIKIINEKIQELEKENNQEETEKDAVGEFTQARLKLEAISFSTQEESKAIQVYYTATAFPEVDNIVKALETAYSLPETSKIRLPLIDTIVKLSARYAATKDEDEIKLLNDTISRLGISSFNDKNYEIDNLKKEITEIENERQKRINYMKAEKQNIINKLEEIQKNINSSNENIDSENQKLDNIVTSTESEEDTEMINNDNDRIFSDESRIHSKDSWMDINTAKALGKYNNEDDMNSSDMEDSISSQKLVENTEDEDFTDNQELFENEDNYEEEDLNFDYEPFDVLPKEDTFNVPHPIKSVKKASAKLISKIYNFDFKKYTSLFKEKIKSALNVMKKNKIATTVGLLAAAGIIASIIGQHNENHDAEVNSLNTTNESTQDANDKDNLENETMDTTEDNINTEYGNSDSLHTENNLELHPVVEEKTNDELFQQELQETLNNILDGDTRVYISADRAVKDEDGKLPTSKQLEYSWQNATPGAYYNVEDGKINKMSEQEAKDYWQDGGQVVVSMNHNGTPIGYVTMDQEVDNQTSEMTK